MLYVKMKFMTLVRGLGTINQVTRMYVEFQFDSQNRKTGVA